MKFDFKENNSKKKIIILIGLPNSGTTITNSYINSMDNGVSISELFQHIAYNQPGKLRFDKLDNDINFNYIKKIIKSLKYNDIDILFKKFTEYLESNKEFDFICFKECFGSNGIYLNKNLDPNNILKNLDFDLKIYLFRNPLYHYNSYKKIFKTENEYSVKTYIDEYKCLYNDFIKNKDKSFCIKYERICVEGKKYINENSTIFLEIVGDESIKQNNYILGNYKMGRNKFQNARCEN